METENILKQLFRASLVSLFVLSISCIPSIAVGQMSQPSERALFQEGLRLYESGLYRQAAEQFQKYSKKDPASALGQTAAYYRALSLGHIDSTQTTYYFRDFIQRYPQSRLSVGLLTELGHRAFQRDSFRVAIDYYEQAIQHGAPDPKKEKLYYWMADAASKSGDNDLARRYFLTLADTLPNSDWSPKALYARGRLYLKENDYAASTEAFELLRGRYPNHEMTRRTETALGESYYQQKEYRKAIEALKNSMPYLGDELKSKAAYLIAESYNYLDEFDNASSYYLRYINWNEGTPQERIAHYGLGWVYYKQEIYHWAAEQFAMAAESQDTLARKSLYYEGVMNKLGGRYPKALKTFQQFGEKFKQGYWVEHGYYEWAITAFEMGRHSEAIEVLLDLVRSDIALEKPDKVYTLLGEAYFANREYTRAIEAFEEAEKLVDISPSVKREARFQKAWVQFRNQAYKQAQPIFEQVYASASNSSLGAEALFWNADSYFNMKEYTRAAGLFDEFVQQFPNHKMAGAAYYSLGWSNFEAQNYEQAVSPFLTFLNKYEPPPQALFPYKTDTQLRLGDAHYAMGEFEKAITYYQKALGAEPGGDYAMFQIANCHYRNGSAYDAVTTFRKVLRIYPYTELREQAQYNVAYVYFLNNNYEQAVAEFKKVIEKYPNTSWAARAQYSIGDAYYNATDYEKAIAAYQKVLEEYPNSDYLIDAVNGIQYAQTGAGMEDTSNEVLENFLNEHPRSGMADRLRFRQAENLMQSGNYEKAIQRFRQYLRITNSEELLAEAHHNMAEAYEQLKKPKEAIQEYETVVNNYSQTSQAATALSALGRIAYEMKNYQQAANYYKQLSGKGSSFAVEANVGLGRSALAQNNIQQANNYFQNALAIDSTSSVAQLGMAKVSFRRQEYGEAEQTFQKIADENTTEIGAEAQYLLGMIYQRQNNCKKAIEMYSKVGVLYSAFDRWVSQSMLEKARCQVSIGQPGEARQTLQRILDNYADTDAARPARKLLNNQ